MTTIAVRLRIFAAFVAGLACANPAFAQSWHIENVDMFAMPLPVRPLSLALDDQDNPHVAYVREGNLIHAPREAGSWVNEIVETSIENPENTITDSSGTSRSAHTFAASSCHIAAYQGLVHVAFMSGKPPGLRHAVKSDGSWSVEMVDERGSSGSRLSLAIGGEESLHVSYGAYPSYFSSPGLKYASLKSGVWEVETVDSTKTGKGRTGGRRLTCPPGIGPGCIFSFQDQEGGHRAAEATFHRTDHREAS